MSYPEFQAMLALLARVVLDARTGGLMLLLVIAAVCDYRTHRIPNRLVLSGAVFGLIYTTVVPPMVHGTVLFPLSGLLVGLLLFLPLYILRAMGAGDVKLLAMIGTFLGPVETLYAALASMIVGGFLSVLWVLARGRMLLMLQNLAAFLQVGLLGALSGSPSGLRIAPEASAGKLPYGIAIAIGTIGYLFLHQLGLL
jgi:prepilin peptidase CpaA